MPCRRTPDRGDRRFSAEWQRIPWFDYLRQSYLINSRFLSDWIEALETEPRAKERLTFHCAPVFRRDEPGEFAATNRRRSSSPSRPGARVSPRIRLLLEDVHKGHFDHGRSVFEVGKNLAVTEGAVIFENELIQLIQYKPVTSAVFKRPLVMFPPCINKYYIWIFARNSWCATRWAGSPVFMVSWRNITEELGHLTWED